MNIYVETNFVLELALQQEDSASCEQILRLCEAGKAQLVVPAYSFAEPHEKLFRQASERTRLQKELDRELGQLKRTAPYAAQINRVESIQDIASLLIQSNVEEEKRFAHYRQRLLTVAEIIPLTHATLLQAATYETPYDLSPQDALIYASVLGHLQDYKPTSSCFLNKNSKDFDNPDIVDELGRYNCKMIPRFDHGYGFIQSQLHP